MISATVPSPPRIVTLVHVLCGLGHCGCVRRRRALSMVTGVASHTEVNRCGPAATRRQVADDDAVPIRRAGSEPGVTTRSPEQMAPVGRRGRVRRRGGHGGRRCCVRASGSCRGRRSRCSRCPLLRSAGLRAERLRLRPEHADEPDPGDGRRDRRPAGAATSSGRSATRCCSSPAPTASAADPLNFQVGYYTEVAGLGRSPSDVVINGSVYVRNQCDADRLHRAEQLLAVAVEPDDQRDHAGLRLLHRRVLGGVAGRADAAGARQRRRRR